MPKSRAPKATRDPEETRTRLLDAAETEFNGPGFFDTDTNRIARTAGYAPQTFYRHFTDKTAIFLAVYDRWWRAESGAVGAIARGKPSDSAIAAMADTMIAFHSKWRGFRRALRHLAIVDDRVRTARAEARLAQLAAIRALPGQPKRSEAVLAAALLKLERVCDAAAEDEFVDLGLSRRDARAAVIEAARVTHGSFAGSADAFEAAIDPAVHVTHADFHVFLPPRTCPPKAGTCQAELLQQRSEWWIVNA